MAVKYFGTPSCGPCRVFKPLLQEVSAELGISIEYIDASVDITSRQQYMVTSVPTIIITDDDAQPIRRHTGGMNRQQLKEFINN